MEQVKQNKYDIWASNMMLLYLLLYMIIGFSSSTGMLTMNVDWLNRVIRIVVAVVLLAMAYSLRLGYKGLKTLYLAAFAWMMIESITKYEVFVDAAQEGFLENWKLFVYKLFEISIAVLLLISLYKNGDLNLKKAG